MTHRQSLLLLALCATMWSLGGLMIKSVALPPLAIAGVRSAIAAVVLTIAVRRLQFIWTKAQWGAALCFVLTVTLFVTATKLTTAANAILLQYTAPVYVAFLSASLLREKITRRDWICLVVILAGMVLFFLDAVSVEHMWGNLVALASGVSFAGTAICLRLQKGKSTLESLLLGNVLTAVVGLPVFVASGVPSWHDGILLLILGVVQLGIPYVLYGIAIRHVTALEATLIPVLEPILNPIWVALFFGEKPTSWALCGGVVVVIAVVVHSLLSVKQAPAAVTPAFD